MVRTLRGRSPRTAAPGGTVLFMGTPSTAEFLWIFLPIREFSFSSVGFFFFFYLILLFGGFVLVFPHLFSLLVLCKVSL